MFVHWRGSPLCRATFPPPSIALCTASMPRSPLRTARFPFTLVACPPDAEGERKMFAGFLQPAGLIDGPLELKPDYRGDRWIGREPVVAPVRLWIRRDHGAVTTTVHVALSAGWG
jgi:hypothetical protein